jgi:GT2 family glycosyltransferase
MTVDKRNLKASPQVLGKFLDVDGEKFYVKGVSYGWFPPEENDGIPYPTSELVRKDFEMMREAGINTVRTPDFPPEYLLEIADELDMKVMVGIWLWHKYVYNEKQYLTHFKNLVRETISRCMVHPCVLMYVIGSEIPSEIVIWHGNHVIEKFLFELYKTAKVVDPDCIVTYCNYPTTDFLNLDFLDVVCFNVYIYYEDGFRAYLSKLQNIASDKPLLLGEIGVDSLRNGEAYQAELLEWKIKASFEGGLCGFVVFQWSDLWWRGGNIILDWKFGLVDEKRVPKKAYHAVMPLLTNDIYSLMSSQPLVSVVVAVYNGEQYLDECLTALTQLNYPNQEIIVVDDGSTDSTPTIAMKYPVTLIRNERNLGLSASRNVGIKAANGDIIAYTDADCRVDPDWLFYIVTSFSDNKVAAVGGPNLTPPEDEFLAHCSYKALGGPKAVLIDDREAEHIPGCNMTFKKDVFTSVEGFDPTYTQAGDDVDLCWRIRDNGDKILYSPGAVVWHHRRSSVKAYYKQQFGYGVAETLLGKKHPEKYGHHGIKWMGKVYGATPVFSFSRPRIYYAPFPYVYMPVYGVLSYLPLTFDWYILAALTMLLTPLSLWILPVSIILVGTSIVSCLFIGIKESGKVFTSLWNKTKTVMMVSVLNFIWPIARGLGRIYGRIWKI